MADDESDSYTEIGDFLSNQYPKFAIMGVFGTVTLVLSNQDSIEPTPLEIRVGLVSSLLIFSITAFWISWKSLTNIKSIGRIPKANEVGYILISLSVTTLGLSVISITSAFSTAVQLIAELAFLAIIILTYLRIYAQGEVLQLKGVVEADRKRQVAFQLGFFVSVYLSLEYFVRVLFKYVFQPLNIGGLIILHISLVVLGFHLVFTYGLYGILNIISEISEIDEHREIFDRIWSVWDLRSSVGLGLLVMISFTAWTSYVANGAIGPNLGYYRIIGLESRFFTLINVGVFTILSVILIVSKDYLTPNWTKPDSPDVFRHRLIEIIGQVMFTLTLILVAYAASVLVPNGRHVIPI
jgi:hypothetical protein